MDGTRPRPPGSRIAVPVPPEEDVRDFDLELKERVARYAYYQIEAEAEGKDLEAEEASEAAYWAEEE